MLQVRLLLFTYRKFILSLLLFWCCTFPGFAQEYFFKSFSVKDGLVESEVNCLYQDSQNFIWIGTEGGLSRFDGRQFQNFTREDGLPSNKVTAITETKVGGLWLGTSKGLAQYRNGKINTFEKYIPEELNILSLLQVEDTLWIGTKEKGLFQYYDHQLVPKPFKTYDDHKNISSIKLAANGDLLITVIHGKAYRYRNGNFQMLDTNYHSAFDIMEDKQEVLWLSTYQGVAKIESTGTSYIRFSEDLGKDFNWINKIITGPKDNLWMATEEGGVVRYDGAEFQFFDLSNGFCGNSVKDILKDHEGNLWFATAGNGLCRWSYSPFTLYNSGLQDTKITYTGKDPAGNLWAATYSGELALWEQNTFVNYPQLKNTSKAVVWDMEWTSPEESWIASNHGITRLYRDKKFTLRPDSTFIKEAVYQDLELQDGDSEVLAAGIRHIYTIGKDTLIQWKNNKSSEDNFQFVFKDSKGRVWAGTNGQGLFIKENAIFKKFSLIPQLRDADVTGMVEDALGNFWISSFGEGLTYLDINSRSHITYKVKDGLETNGLVSLSLTTNDQLWIGTNTGLTQMDVEDYYRFEQPFFINYNSASGFPSSECMQGAIYAEDQNLWLGTIDGVVHYKSSSVPERKLPQPYITSVHIPEHLDQLAQISDIRSKKNALPINLKLPHDQNFLAIEFSAIQYSEPENVRYRYRLISDEPAEWSPPLKSTDLFFTNLQPDAYTLELQAGLTNSKWNPQTFSYTFTILAPFWKRTWFIGSIICLTLILIMALFNFRRKQYLKRTLKLEQIVRKRTQKISRQNRQLEKQNKEKESLIKEIHHRVKNNLQLTSSLLALQSQSSNDLKVQNILKEGQARIKSMSFVHQKLYETDNFSDVDFQEYLLELSSAIQESYQENATPVEIEVDAKSVHLPMDLAIPLGLIINELLTNAFKYAFEGTSSGKIWISLNCSFNGECSLVIKDNGKGIDDASLLERPKNLGFQLVQLFTRQIEGRLCWEIKDGCRFELIFPYKTVAANSANN